MMELQFPLHNDTSRKIIHIDMDAFFASVEERDHPEFRGHPCAVVSSSIPSNSSSAIL